MRPGAPAIAVECAPWLIKTARPPSPRGQVDMNTSSPTRSSRAWKAAGSAALLALLLPGSFGCGSSSSGSTCTTLLQQYATELQNALICDPGVANQCEAQRPVVVILVDGQTQTLEGLSSNCTHAVNGSRTATLDHILSEYTAQGCKMAPTPICQAPMDSCQLNSQGTYTCLP